MMNVLELTTLKENPRLYNEVIELIEKSFQYSLENSFSIDFAPLMEKKNWHNCHIALINKKVVGHLGVLPKEIKLGKNTLPILFMGGICVSEDYRGSGVFSTLMNHINHKERDKYAFYLLWSDKIDLYKKFDFYNAGGMVEIFNESEMKKNSFETTKLADLNDREFQQVKDIYKKDILRNYTSIKRSNEEWNTLKKITSADISVKKLNGEIVSYFIINKGQDLQNVVHEFASLPENKEESLKEISGHKLWLPEKDEFKVENHSLNFMALLKIASPALFCQFMYLWSKGQIQVTNIIGNEVIFLFHGDQFKEDLDFFLTMAIGPNPIEEFKDVGKPLYISGLDSI